MKISPMSLSVLFGVIPFLLLPEILEGNFLSRFLCQIWSNRLKEKHKFEKSEVVKLMRFVTLNCVF